MKKIYIVIVLTLISSFLTKLQAQTDSDAEIPALQQAFKTDDIQPVSRLKAEHGTYQFFILGEDSTQLLRTDLAEKIESYRDEYAVVHLKVSSTTTIRILPCSEITSTRFNPVNNEVVFQPDSRDPSAGR
ncbi:MAG: hypothetical protein NTV09_11695 [Bacteroidetes bacterium]|nr:hypothetical protein [Bacteroidota bacterium]